MPTLLPPLLFAAHSLSSPIFLQTAFFRGIKEVQKGKLNNPNDRVEIKKNHFLVNVTILVQNKHSLNNEALVWICDANDGHKYSPKATSGAIVFLFGRAEY